MNSAAKREEKTSVPEALAQGALGVARDRKRGDVLEIVSSVVDVSGGRVTRGEESLNVGFGSELGFGALGGRDGGAFADLETGSELIRH